GARLKSGTRALIDQVERELGRGVSQLLERPRLQLADAFARDAELLAHVLEGLRGAAGEAEAPLEDLAQPRLGLLERLPELGRLQALGRRHLRLRRRLVLDQVRIEAVSVTHRRLEADRILDQLEQLFHATLREAALGRHLGDRRIAVQLLSKDAP